MIGSVTSAAQSAYQTGVAQAARTASTAPAQTDQSDDATNVTLSPQGQKQLELPKLILDPKVHMANAEKRLNELMQQLGIPSDTKIDIKLSSSGQFTVSGDNDRLSELQDMLNDGSERELRNSLIGAHTAATIQRIAAASQKTQQQVEASPQSAELLWNQMLAQADRIKNQSMDFSFSGGSLAAAFADGTTVSVA